MWDRVSSDFLGLGLGLLIGPIAVLTNQGLLYISDVWVCGSGPRPALYLVPLLCLLVSIAAGVSSYLHWVGADRGLEDERGGAETRTRFLALMGMGSAAISSLLIVAQWAAAIVFQPCMRA